jgi:hypothetical protein
MRVYCDGTHGGQETTFGQNEVYSGAELERARQDAALTWLAKPDSLLRRIRLLGRQTIAGEVAFVLQVASDAGDPTRYAVSARTSLIVRKTTPTAEETYSDFRNVSGVVLPFHTLIADELGESDVTVRDMYFDVAVPATAFAAHVAGFGRAERAEAGSR